MDNEGVGEWQKAIKPVAAAGREGKESMGSTIHRFLLIFVFQQCVPIGSLNFR